MARKPDPDSVCGLEIPVEQRTPLVDALLHVIEQLQATNQQLQTTVQRQQLRIEQLEEEIRRLKGLPEPPKRPPQTGFRTSALALNGNGMISRSLAFRGIC
jgi:hypothetical protein